MMDLDDYIVKKGGQTIAKLFEFGGEHHFRKIETQALTEVIAQYPDHIIAVGGGTPVFFDNMEKMKTAGIVFYLEASNQIIFDRIKNTGAKRPLLQDKSPEEIKSLIETMVDQRSVFYRQAHLAVEIKNESVKPQEIIFEYLKMAYPSTF